LRELDLYAFPTTGRRIVSFAGRFNQIEIEHIGCNNFADAADEVAVEGEFSSWEYRFQSVGSGIKRIKQSGHFTPLD
jgi:hypothetical protein